MTYDWDLMLRLLREAQKSGNESFTPRQYADEHALAAEEAGQPRPNMASLKAEAQNDESLLFEGGYMVARPEEEGGNGENFVLTDRGVRLMEMLEGGAGRTENRRRLDEKGEAALVPEVFDGVATAGEYLNESRPAEASPVVHYRSGPTAPQDLFAACFCNMGSWGRGLPLFTSSDSA